MYGKTRDLLNPYHIWVLNSETLRGMRGKYRFNRTVYFKGNQLVFSSKNQGVIMESRKTFMSNTLRVLDKV
jgi:hypothetical protein